MKPKSISSHDACLPVGCITNDGAMVTHQGGPPAKKQKQRVKQRVIHFTAKCSDMFSASLTEYERNESGSEVQHPKGDYEGYVPDFFPGQHFGDYVEMTVDVDTGQILNWKKPTLKQLAIFKT